MVMDSRDLLYLKRATPLELMKLCNGHSMTVSCCNQLHKHLRAGQHSTEPPDWPTTRYSSLWLGEHRRRCHKRSACDLDGTCDSGGWRLDG